MPHPSPFFLIFFGQVGHGWVISWMRPMVDSVNIDTVEMNIFLLTHVDDEGQPFSSDIDI